jgi:hypothetical protein
VRTGKFQAQPDAKVLLLGPSHEGKAEHPLQSLSLEFVCDLEQYIYNFDARLDFIILGKGDLFEQFRAYFLG